MNRRNNSSFSLSEAKNYAFLLLKYRPRSEKEIYQRLKNKKFNETAIKETLFFLKEKRFIDDNLFTKIWIETRINKGLGLRRIRSELKLKGIDSQLLNSQLEEINKSYSEEKAVSEIAQKRINRLKGVEPQKAKQRVFAYLARRGFSPDIIIDVVDKFYSVNNGY